MLEHEKIREAVLTQIQLIKQMQAFNYDLASSEIIMCNTPTYIQLYQGINKVIKAFNIPKGVVTDVIKNEGSYIRRSFHIRNIEIIQIEHPILTADDDRIVFQ